MITVTIHAVDAPALMDAADEIKWLAVNDPTPQVAGSARDGWSLKIESDDA